MKEKFKGPNGRQLLIEGLLEQKFVEGNTGLAKALADHVELQDFPKGSTLIEQNNNDDDIFILLAGKVDILINGKHVATRHAGTTVGEMAAVNPLQRRSATVVASDEVLAGKLSEAKLGAIADRHPRIWRFFAKDLARKLLERNKLINERRDKIEIFIISSVEALPIARAIQTSLEHDPFNVIVWTDGVFRAGKYTLESLERALDTADFAVAIAQPDEEVSSRNATVQAPRDNVIFELGFFMGRLGRMRAVLFEPRGDEVELPSDLKGITSISYKSNAGKYTADSIAPACNHLRDLIVELGPLSS